MEKSEVDISSVVLLRNQDKTDTQIIQNLVKCQEYTELILVSNDLEFVFLDTIFKLQYHPHFLSLLKKIYMRGRFYLFLKLENYRRLHST